MFYVEKNSFQELMLECHLTIANGRGGEEVFSHVNKNKQPNQS